MEAALALAAPLLALAAREDPPAAHLDAEAAAMATGSTSTAPDDPAADEVEEGTEAEAGEASVLDGRALLRRRLRGLGDDEVHALVRLLEARLTLPPLPPQPSPTSEPQPPQLPQAQLPAAGDLLQALLAAPRTAVPAIAACVALIAQGRLAGRQAVRCASAIREALSTDLAVAVAGEEDDEGQDGSCEEEEMEEMEGDADAGAEGAGRRGRPQQPSASRPRQSQLPTEAQLRRRAALLAALRALLFTTLDALLPPPGQGGEGSEAAEERRLRLRLAEAGPGRLNDFALLIDVAWPLLLLAQRLEDALRLWAAAAARRRQQQRRRRRRRSSGEREQGQEQEQERSQEAEGGEGCWEPPETSVGEEAAAAVVGRPWPAPLTLQLLGLCRDMYEFVAEGDAAAALEKGGEREDGVATWARVRRQIRLNACPPAAACSGSKDKASDAAAAAVAEKLLASDGAGLMRQCLLLAEAQARRAPTMAAAVEPVAGAAAAAARRSASSSNGSSSIGRTGSGSSSNPWLALFRRLYHATPPEALATTELVLEQSLRQALPCVGLLARDLEARLAQQLAGAAGGEEGEGGEIGICWRDAALLLLLRRTVAGWPLSSLLASAAAVASGGRSGRGGGSSGGLDLACSHRLLDGLLLALLLHLAAQAAAAAAAAGAASSASAMAGGAKPATNTATAASLLHLLLGTRRAIEAIVTHGASGLDSGLLLLQQPQQQHHRRRLCLGRLTPQRSAQLFEASMAWLRDAERACHDLDRHWPSSFAASSVSFTLRPADLRALAAAAISALYGAAPEGQARVLSALLGAIVEHSSGGGLQDGHQPPQHQQHGAGDAGDTHALALTPAGAALVRALGAITAEWPSTLRQHTGVFQHLVARLPTLPSPLACAVVRASAPLATACPAYLDALLAVVRKCIVRADVAGRAFGMAALTALLTVSAASSASTRGGGHGHGNGLLSRADRGEEVAAMFDSLLGLALPLPLKARLYRAIADAAAASAAAAPSMAASRSCPLGLGGRLSLGASSSSSSSSASGSMHISSCSSGGRSAAVPLLRASMGRRLARFIDRGTGRLSPLSLFEECRRASNASVAGDGNGGAAALASSSSSSVALRDDLPELLRCVLSINNPASGTRGPAAASSLAEQVARLVLCGDETEAVWGAEEATDPDAAWANRALEGVVAFLRDGAPMDGKRGAGHDEGEEAAGVLALSGKQRRAQGRGRGKGGVLPPCRPDSVSASEKLHVLLALVEALLDAALAPAAIATAPATAPALVKEEQATRTYQAALELYRLHGMLSDVAEALGVKPRAKQPSLDGAERAVPLLRLEGAAALLRLVWARVAARGKGKAVGAEREGDGEEQEGACGLCAEARRRFALWAVQHAALSCRRALEVTGARAAGMQGGEEHHRPEQGAEAAAAAVSSSDVWVEGEDGSGGGTGGAAVVSPAALLPVLLDLYAGVPKAFAWASPTAAATDEEKVDDKEEEGRSNSDACSRCQAVHKAAALKQQATALAAAPTTPDPALAVAAAASNLRRRGPALAAQAAWRQAAARLPLAAAFLAGVDGKARRVVEEELEASAADPGAAVLEARVALLDLIRAVVQRLQQQEQQDAAVPGAAAHDEGEGSSNSNSNSSSTSSSSSSPAGLLPFVDTLATELGTGLVADGGLPLRLVQAYLDLLEALIDLLPPTPAKGDDSDPDALVVARAYSAWRLALARRLLLPLARARVAQAAVIRRFVRLALAAAPLEETVALTDGVMAAGSKFLGEWLREARNAYLRRRRGGGGRGDEEVVTAAEARELLEEEGDGELYPDRRGGESGSDDDDGDGDGDGERARGAAAPSAGAAEKGAQEEEEEEEEEGEGQEDGPDAAAKKAVAAQLGRMRFASPTCWQAAVLPVLARWEQLLLPSPPALDRQGFADMLRHLPAFFRPLDVGGQSTIYSAPGTTTKQPPPSLAAALSVKDSKHHKVRVAAFFLPGPLKPRLLSLLSRLFALARPAAARVGRRLRRLRRAAEAEDEDEDEQKGGVEGRQEQQQQQQQQQQEGDARADAGLLSAYLPMAADVTAAVRAWAGAERQQRGGGASAALRKRLPALLFALERMDLVLQRLAQQCVEHAAARGPDWLLPVEGGGGRRRKGAEGEKAALCPLAARLVRWHHEHLAWEEKENRAPPSQQQQKTGRRGRDESDSGSGSEEEEEESEEEEEDDDDDYDLALLAMRGGGGGGGRKRKRGKKRLRSRNVVVDKWLAEEGEGEDAYADLEDFIMEDEYT